MADEPTHWELSRRLDASDRRLDQGLASIAARLDELPSEKTILALLAARDAQNQALADDVRGLEKAIGEERIVRERAIANEKKDRQDETAAAERRAIAARNIALSAAGLCLTALLGIIGFISGLGGA